MTELPPIKIIRPLDPTGGTEICAGRPVQVGWDSDAREPVMRVVARIVPAVSPPDRPSTLKDDWLDVWVHENGEERLFAQLPRRYYRIGFYGYAQWL